MIRLITLTTASALIAAAAAPAMAGEMPQLVDCTISRSIQDVLDGVDPDPGETLTFTVRGLCTEDVVIVSDDITLQGESPLDGILGGGSIVDGAQRVVIDNLTVSGSPGDGILAENGAAVTVSNSTVSNARRWRHT